MAAAYIPNHAALMQGRLTWQFQGKPNLAAIVAAHGAQYQAIEDAFRDIAVYRPFGPTCATDPLTRWGAAVGAPRPTTGPAASSDLIYYEQVLGKIQSNVSTGTSNELEALFVRLGATGATYIQSSPANVTINYAGTVAVDDATLRALAVASAPPIGINIFNYTAPPFGFAGNPIAAGFGVGHLARRL